MRRRALLAGVVALMLAFLACSTKKSPALTDPKSTEAHTIANVWWLMCGLAAAVYIVVAGFILIAAFPLLVLLLSLLQWRLDKRKEARKAALRTRPELHGGW